jgi:hypothetical protein
MDEIRHDQENLPIKQCGVGELKCELGAEMYVHVCKGFIFSG